MHAARGCAPGLAAVVLNTSRLIAEFEHNLRNAGLHRPHVSFRAVDAINRDPRTGKVRRFIPLTTN